MSYFPHLLTLVGVWVVLTITPGPDFAVTFHYATTRSRHDGVFVALGVTTGLTIWITGSMAGLGVLFAHFSWLVEIIRTLGALYLTYLGIKRSSPTPTEDSRRCANAPFLCVAHWLL